MIVKVQQSLHTSHGERQVLAYDQERTFTYEGLLLESVAEVLGTRPKVYFEAEVVDGNLVLIGEVPVQLW